jgi:hypothetical protein
MQFRSTQVSYLKHLSDYGIILSAPIISQITVAVLGLMGAAISLFLLRSIRLCEWRQAGYRFAAAIRLYSVLELLEVTDIFYDPPWIQILAQGTFILYMVYGIFDLTQLIREEAE